MTSRKPSEKEQVAQSARAKLVAKAKAGDEEAQAKLMERHRLRVYTPEEIKAFEKL